MLGCWVQLALAGRLVVGKRRLERFGGRARRSECGWAAGSLRSMSSDLSWLPEHHLSVAATLAHADRAIGHVGDLVLDYSRDGDVLDLKDDRTQTHSITRVVGTKPLAREIALWTADALTTLRAAVEHTLFAEVVHLMERPLTSAEIHVVEMPAKSSAEGFETWVDDKRRKRIAPLRRGAELLERVRSLQPYQRTKDPGEHPMRVLAEHSNVAKHRMPAVTATRVGRVVPDIYVDGLDVPTPSGLPIEVGDVIASAPIGRVVPMSIFATVGVERPHTGAWPVLMAELGWLAEWVRTVAVPTLVTGVRSVDPLPATFDIEHGHMDERAAIAAGSQFTSNQRINRELRVSGARAGLPKVLSLHPSRPDPVRVAAWVGSLSDDEVLERLGRLQPGTTVDAVIRTAAVAAELLDEALGFSQAARSSEQVSSLETIAAPE